jgi:hypothetical protein
MLSTSLKLLPPLACLSPELKTPSQSKIKAFMLESLEAINFGSVIN